MAQLYNVSIQFVSPEYKTAVKKVILHQIGDDKTAEAERLVEEGGSVEEKFTKTVAIDFANRLKNAGAKVEISPAEPQHFYNVRLISIGIDKFEVIKTVRNITGLTLQDSKKIVDTLGIVQKEVDEISARKMKSKLEAAGATVKLEPVEDSEQPEEKEEYHVYGKVSRSNGKPVGGMLIRAYDCDLRNEQLLGEASTNGNGNYQISYTAEDFKKAEKHHADLKVRVYNEVGKPLEATSTREEIIFNAQPEEEVNLKLESESVQPSEFERLQVLLQPALDGADPASLTDKEINFLIHESEIAEFEEEFPAKSNSIRFFAQSAQLSTETEIPAEVFYGWARKEIGILYEDDQVEIDLATILKEEDGTLRDTLAASIEENIIPFSILDHWDAILSLLDEARDNEGLFTEHKLQGQLLNKKDERPLFGYQVRAYETGEENSLFLTARTDQEGFFEMRYRSRAKNDGTDRKLILKLQTDDGNEKKLKDVPAGRKEPVIIKVEIPKPPQAVLPGDEEENQITNLSNFPGFNPPNSLTDALGNIGAKSLKDIRRLIGKNELDGLSEEFGEENIETLKSHAELSLVSPDAEVRTTLIDKGYTNPLKIAEAPLERLIRDTEGTLDRTKAVEIGYIAKAQAFYLDSVVTGINVENELDPDRIIEIDQDALEGIKRPDKCACDCNHALSPNAYLADLLDYVTTHLDREGPEKVTLEYLHERFHQPFDKLPATCRFQKEKVHQVRICVEVLRGYLGGPRGPDAEHLNRQKEQEKTYRYEVYQRLLDQLGTKIEELSEALNDEEERKSLAQQLGIGESHLQNGAIYLTPESTTEHKLETLFGYQATTDPLSEKDMPGLLKWQHEYLRKLWMAQDHPEEEQNEIIPIIDPDLVIFDDLRASRNYTLLRNRQKFVEEAKSTVSSRDKSLSGFDEILVQDLSTNRSDLQEKYAEANDEGIDITGYLKEKGLTETALRYLCEAIKSLEEGNQLVEEKWENIYNIVVQAKKRNNNEERNNYEEWKEQEKEAGITISPVFFEAHRRDFVQLLDDTPSLAWRIDQGRRREWERTLRARIMQKQALTEGFYKSVSDVEEAMLPTLRDILIEASRAEGDTLEEKAEWITEQFHIDAKTSGCKLTTRVARAIETIQNLIFSIRTGQIDDSVANFNPLPESFDQDWHWMGSYATWKAATAVHLYPETVLHPTLRMRKTPGFKNVADYINSQNRFDPQLAREAAKQYQDYFNDVYNLDIKANCWAYIGEAVDPHSPILFLFAKGGVTSRLYWSMYDPNNDNKDYAQTYWEEIPGTSSSSEIIGASYYKLPDRNRNICLFLSTPNELDDKDELSLHKFDLKGLAWDTSAEKLSLPEALQGQLQTVLVTKPNGERYRTSPPELLIYNKGTEELFLGQLDSKAEKFEYEGDWMPLFSYEPIQIEIEEYEIIRYYWKVSPFDVELEGRPERYTEMTGEAYLTLLKDGTNLPEDFEYPYPISAAVEIDSNDTKIVFKNGVNIFVANYSQIRKNLRTVKLSPQIILVEDAVEIEKPKEATIKGRTDQLEFIADFKISNESRRIGVTHEYFYWRTVNKNGSWNFYKNNLNVRLYSYKTKVINHLGRDPLTTTYKTRIPPNKKEAQDGLLNIPVLDGYFREGWRSYQRKVNGFSGLHVGIIDVERWTTLSPIKGNAIKYPEVTEEISSFTERYRNIRIAGLFHYVNLERRKLPLLNLDYVNEAYYSVPLLIAQRLQLNGHFKSALDWYRSVYNYENHSNRQIFNHILLEQDASSTNPLQRADDWFRDPLNPHTIASSRKNAYLRFTLISIIRCLLEYADEEFTRDSSESLNRARTLYITALELMDTEALKKVKKKKTSCDELVIEILNAVDDPELGSSYHTLMQPIYQEMNTEQAREFANSVVEKHQEVADSEFKEQIKAIKEVTNGAKVKPTFSEIQASNREYRNQTINLLSTDTKTGQSLAGFANNLRGIHNGSNATAGSNGNGSTTDINFSTVDLSHLFPPLIFGGSQFLPYQPTSNHSFCILPNPVIKALHQHASVNLQKLRTCRNIAGLQRQVEAYAAPTDVASGMSGIQADGSLALPGTTPLQPTPYRYNVLINRAKELTDLAQQIENSYLSAMQSRSAERYNLLKAEQDIELSRAGVRLQDLRVDQAEEQVTLAGLQQDRAQIQFAHYDGLIKAGLISHESTALDLMHASAVSSYAAAALHAAAGVSTAISLKNFWSSGGAVLSGAAAAASATASGLSTSASIFSTWASYQRRDQEWKFARKLAKQDARIGNQQIRIAESGVQVTEQERDIAELQTDHAETTANFLANKELNEELYHWMTGVLRGVYAFFLQQATATARLAEHQLAFERQEALPGYIQSDYWKITTNDVSSYFQQNEEEEDRMGLTGSARLQQDVYQLDQYAFETDERKLQLSQTISLSRIDPVAFQKFRETGVMIFETPMEMFNEEFPGHYLRLIKRVRTSLIALTPPTRGIRASLTSTGISRVVIGNGMSSFHESIIRREPEMIAFTSPQNATGLFELNPQSEMLNPFEGNGVDTIWELRMPKPANPFDYNSIADVLVTIEYTALHSYDYQQQVIKELDSFATGDRAFSFRQEFADAWYDLHNPDQTDTPMTVKFETRREDFPPNISDPRIKGLVLYFASDDKEALDNLDVDLKFTEQGSTSTTGGVIPTTDGVISTRRAHGSGWGEILNNKSPSGEWELSLPDETRELFTEEKIDDILFVVTYSGEKAKWPE